LDLYTMKSVLFILLLSLVFSACIAQDNDDSDTNGGQTPAGPAPPCQRPHEITCFDENCFCHYDWIGPAGDFDHWRLNDLFYGSFHDLENWSPVPILWGYPCDVCFVKIQGPGTTFIDIDTKVNTLTIGGRQWDFTNVFVGGVGRAEHEPVILTVGYDDIPIIKRVDGQRICNGQTLLTITGKGFGFCPDDLTITVSDHTEDRPQFYQYQPLDCDYPLGCDYPGVPSIIDITPRVFPCSNVRIFFLDQKISCTVSIPDVFAQQLWVTVQSNIRNPPVSDTVEWLTTYVK